MKPRLCFALCVLVVASLPVPRKSSYSPTASGQHVEKDTKGSQGPAVGGSAKNPPRANPQKEGSEIEPTAKDRSVTVSKPVLVLVSKDGWDRAYIILTGLLVAVGIFTFIGVLIQAVETRRAAQAARDSVRIQEAALRQWIRTKNWWIEWPGGNVIDITFDVVNPTQIPLWLDLAVLKTGSEEKGDGAGVWLVPKKSYRMAFRFSLTDEQKFKMEKAELAIDLECSVCFRDAMKNHWQQKSNMVLTRPLGKTIVTEARTSIFDSTPPENNERPGHN